MPRKPIIAVIGGNQVSEQVFKSASRFGLILSNQGFLLTGGGPDGPPREVKNAAMRGSAGASGLMISVLPRVHGKVSSCTVEGRRIVLQTELGSFERDPITGTVGDVVVVFSGGTGTLVELAYAALKQVPILFLRSLEPLSSARKQHAAELPGKLNKARAGYPLIPTDERQLIDALDKNLLAPQCVDAPEQALEEALRLSVGSIRQRTRFLGLPNNHSKIVDVFERHVTHLSEID